MPKLQQLDPSIKAGIGVGCVVIRKPYNMHGCVTWIKTKRERVLTNNANLT